jgi:hypothetical protein
MDRKPSLPHPRLTAQFIAATFAGVVAVGILASVTELFVRDGWPMERLAVAERACVATGQVAEHDACMRQWLSAPRAPIIAASDDAGCAARPAAG